MAVGAEEDEFETRVNASKAHLDEERIEALEMYRAITKALAKFAVKAVRAITKKIGRKDGGMGAAMWYLEHQVPEFKEHADPVVNISTAGSTVLYTPDNGRIPKNLQP